MEYNLLANFLQLHFIISSQARSSEVLFMEINQEIGK
jgi:hypothetical protein